ncbi:GyrI-like domain-containing protein [Bacillus sp. Bva_UNVM-123]|uniref:GyrI-like domain-containing protein n=1 Tax=Bacillus sp. Bva_UNVM-123 TaxID=2829798 RepID=UPI00391F325B
MKLEKVDFQIIGIKHTANFAEYPTIIPDKVQQMQRRENELSNVTTKRVIVYEPKKDRHHDTGYFYTGVIVKEENKNIPDDMEALHLAGEYAVLETIFDGNRMGEFYTKLDQWILENGYRHKQDELIIEVYEEKDGELALTIYMPFSQIIRSS